VLRRCRFTEEKIRGGALGGSFRPMRGERGAVSRGARRSATARRSGGGHRSVRQGHAVGGDQWRMAGMSQLEWVGPKPRCSFKFIQTDLN
jgi:hypothetical protein